MKNTWRIINLNLTSGEKSSGILAQNNTNIMDQIKDTFNYLEMNKSSLTSSQYDFVKSLKKYFRAKKNLTPRQIDSLQSIRKYMNVTVPSD